MISAPVSSQFLGSSCQTVKPVDLYQAYRFTENIGSLSELEVQQAIDTALSLHPGKPIQFAEINHAEPSKEELLKAVADQVPLARRAEVISFCVDTNETFVDIVDVSCSECKDACGESKVFTDVQVGISPDEYQMVERLCKAYTPLLESLRKRGLNPQHLVADAWCLSDNDPSERICWPSLYFRNPEKDDLPYSRPIDGVAVKISLTRGEIIYFNDSRFLDFPVPSSEDARSNYYPPQEWRRDVKPLIITQPEGPSFSVERSNHVHWQKWSMQVGFTSKEGLILTGVCYAGRPILHRFSMVEMVVPYGDPRPPHCWKNAFDAGEDGLGRNANSLKLGCDCLGHIHYFDAVVVTDDGGVRTIKNAICMHEEDASLAWKHTDWRTDEPRSARNRRLVLSFICTIANYEYGFYYHFYMDGNIEADVKLTGVLSTGALSYKELEAGTGSKYGVTLGKTLYAPVHQHFFVARMDFAIDGVQNSVMEWNAQVEVDDPETNPADNGFFFRATLLENEQQAKRHCNSDSSRFWQVLNPSVNNAIGSPVSYRLNPKTSIKPFARLQRAKYLRRAQFLEYQVWVTPHHPEERFPGGEFPNQCQTVEGLPRWTQQNRNLVNTDLVMWHVFGVTHCPRPEEWPVMPAEHCGFKLTPFGFFDHSPAMDIPQTVHTSEFAHTMGMGVGEVAESCCGHPQSHHARMLHHSQHGSAGVGAGTETSSEDSDTPMPGSVASSH